MAAVPHRRSTAPATIPAAGSAGRWRRGPRAGHAAWRASLEHRHRQIVEPQVCLHQLLQFFEISRSLKEISVDGQGKYETNGTHIHQIVLTLPEQVGKIANA